jgi:hypothetical protein
MGQLLTDALVIKNETQQNANTATRVGGWMQAAATAIEETPSVLNFFDYNSGGADTLTEGVWKEVKMDAETGFSRNGLSVDGAGLVSYTGTAKHFRVTALLAILGSSNRKIHFAVFKNGELWPCSEFVSVLPSANEVTIPSQCVVPMSSGNTIQMYYKCSTHTTSVTLDNINVIINEF